MENFFESFMSLWPPTNGQRVAFLSVLGCSFVLGFSVSQYLSHEEVDTAEQRVKLAEQKANAASLGTARHLSDDQKAAIIRSLSAAGSGQFAFSIMSTPSCEECELYAQELRYLIKEIPNWSADGSPAIFGGHQDRGLQMIVKAGAPRPKNANIVVNALLGAGIAVSWAEDPSGPDDQYTLLVGRPAK